MAFLDNSGDIILDAVLTDTGRFRLAKGDGSFKIAKFVFADDEINYGLYDKNNASGSAYYDLSILQTPVFEAFTNNTSVVKSPLLSILNQNLLYLPVMKLNTNVTTTKGGARLQRGVEQILTSTNNIAGTPLYSATNSYIVTTESGSTNAIGGGSGLYVNGVFDGYTLLTQTAIRVDQGLDTTELPATKTLEPTLVETQFIVELDYRLGRLVGAKDEKDFTPSFVDDDQVASYYFTNNDIGAVESIGTDQNNLQAGQVIQGPRGNLIAFKIRSSEDLTTSTFLFTRLGATMTFSGVSGTFYYIDTFVKVRGVTTGTSISIPVRFVRKA
jgi:hypothetical protein